MSDPPMNKLWATKGRIFSHVRPFYEQAVSDLHRSINSSQ
jgi:hypothetical protein